MFAPRAAWVQARRVARNALIDLRHGRLLVGSTPSRHRHLGAKDVVNSDHRALDLIFTGTIRRDDVLVDVGCGRGRVINWWLDNGYRRHRIIGLELDEEIAAQTAKRLRRFPNVMILAGDAIANLPADGTLFYLYNPFTGDVLERFIARFREVVPPAADPRILYYHPKYVSLFDPAVWQIVQRPVGSPSPLPFNDLAIIRYAERPASGAA